MTTKPHPTDTMEMPPRSILVDGECFYSADQLRSERIKTYDLCRQEALEDAAKACKPHEDDDELDKQAKSECVKAIRSLKS